MQYRNLRRHLQRLTAALLLTLLIIPQLGCQAKEDSANWQGISKTNFCLDTVCQITVYGMNDPDGRLAAMDEDAQQKEVLQLITDAFSLCSDDEKLLSKTIEDSEIAKINRAGGKPTEVSKTTAEVIRAGIDFGELSDGVFDITIGKASALWNFHDVDEAHETTAALPDEDALAEAIGHVDYRKIRLRAVSGDQRDDAAGNGEAKNGAAKSGAAGDSTEAAASSYTVTLEDPQMEIDLGGIAKGYIADRVAEFLEERGVNSAVINLGGNIVTIGGKAPALLADPQEQTDFSISIVDPLQNDGSMAGRFTCRDKVIVTSGTYERYIEKDGKRYHHILDVKTGWPVDTDVLSVTIIGDKGRGADADGLSTTCLALGAEEGLRFVEKIAGVEAIFIDTEGQIHATDGAPKL